MDARSANSEINRDHAGRISIMRNGREIYYDIVPRILPSGVDKIDRYIGIEVSFPAELDEYFQVRNVKRGAEPVSKLREELREWLKLSVIQVRKEIGLHWKEVEISQQTKPGLSAAWRPPTLSPRPRRHRPRARPASV